MKTFKQILEELYACDEAVRWAGDMTIEEVVSKCHRGDWLLWLGQQLNIDLNLLTLCKGHCANTIRYLINDEKVIKGIDIAIAFGENKVTYKDLIETMREVEAICDDCNSQEQEAFGSVYFALSPDRSFSCASYAARAVGYTDYDNFETLVDQNRLETANICRKYIGKEIIDEVNLLINGDSNLLF